MKVLHVVGARPNFMKISPIIKEMSKYPGKFDQILVHTGQHYDDVMWKTFWEDLHLPKPDIFLGIGSGTHAEQTAKIMIEFEKVCLYEKPALVLVVGDVNSTLACSLVAAKLHIPIAHVEAGLRSFDRTMPEEINRIVTDSISDILFTTCEDANENLRKENIPEEKIYFIGNVMIDTLLKCRKKAHRTKILERLGLKKELSPDNSVVKINYAILTLHRPSNVDNKYVFQEILEALKIVSKKIPIIFPIHPRTKKQVEKFNFQDYLSFNNSNAKNSKNPDNSINCVDPLGYLDFLHLMANSDFMLTDSGGIQEEATILGIPCLTLRENTERPITIREGTNVLVGSDKNKIITESLRVTGRGNKTGTMPKYWDGKAAQRIVKILREKF